MNTPNPIAKKDDTLRVRIPKEVKTWLKRAAAKQHVDVSDLVRPLVMKAFGARHSK